MSDTPRTDEVLAREPVEDMHQLYYAYHNLLAHARTLEREIAELQTRLAHMSED